MVIYGYVISPVIRSGYVEDDRLDSIWAVSRKAAGVSGVEGSIYWTQVYTNSLGRFHPLAHLIGSYAFEITNIQTFKLLSYVATLIAVFTVSLFLLSWTNKKEIVILFLLVLSSVSQYRISYDPILGFGMHTKVLVLLLGFQLLVLTKIKKDRNPQGLVYVVLLVLLLCSALYHELSVLAFLALIPLTLSLTKRKKVVTLVLISWTFASYVLVRISLYLLRENLDLAFYQIQMNPFRITRTYLQQLSGLIPFLSTKNWEYAGLGAYVTPWLFVLTICGLISVLSFRNVESDVLGGSDLFALLSSGLVLVLLPAGASALSFGHGNIDVWWDGYINVWIMQIGFSIGFAVLILTLWAKPNATLRRVLAVSMVCIFPLMIVAIKRTNDLIVDGNPQWTQNKEINGWEREQTLRAVKSGFLDVGVATPELLSLPPRVWMSDKYLKTFSVNVAPISNYWERFAPMPVSALEGCLEKRKMQIHGFKERTYSCQGSGGKVFSSVATSFVDGYSIIAEPIYISISDNPVVEQFKLNQNSTFVKNARLFLTGSYKSCKGVVAMGISGTAKGYDLWFKSNAHYLKSGPENGFDLNTLKLVDCG
jgi:hypothetical protein